LIDLHTHFLWDWDDGPDDRSQALTMCRIAEKDGTTAICLTPHVFRANRHGDDLGTLSRRMADFHREMRAAGVEIEFHWGAEVFVHADVVPAIEKYRFTIDETSYVFLEFDHGGVPVGASAMLSRLMGRGFVPIISHPERNRGFTERPELLYEFVSMGCAAQLTAASLTGELGREVRATAGLFLVNNLVHIIASDAHRALGRPPGLSRAVEAASKIVGESKARAMVTDVPRAILENRALPDWGEPKDPSFKRTWTQRLIGMPRRPSGGPPGNGAPEGKWRQRRGSSRTTILKVKE